MEVWELITKLLKESEGLCFLEVRVDSSVPKPIEDIFEIRKGKGMLLFVEKKGKEKKK